MNETLERLRREWPDATFLALGQTALWDEPVKAALRLRLDAFWPEARIVAGVHDSDYFAKLPGHPAAARQKFALVSHDDNATRGLWSAAGEMSQLFGSEDVATRNLLKRDGGVSLHHALAFADDPDETLGDLTRAWGWRGIIQGGWKKSVTAEIPLFEILATLREQLCWALDGSADRLEGHRAEAGRELCRALLSRINAFSESHPSATLADLYRELLPHFYEQLLGAPAQNLETTQTTELLKLTPETASLPRFAFVDAFLNPTTRKSAEEAYNLALGGGDIYTLDHFGEGAIPFDVIVGGQGRGTLHITADEIRIDAPRAIVVPGTATSVKELAEKLAHLGEITLVGKAVSLLPMLAAEFVLVFHEGASSYSSRTRALTEEMAKRGISLPKLRPILRVEYKTWDALRAVPGAESTLVTLPEFLRQALNRERITLLDFAVCWPRAIEWETARLNALKPLRSPRALLAHFGRTLGADWMEKASQHEALTEKLVGLYGKTVALKDRELAERKTLKSCKTEVSALYRAKGEAFRAGEDRSRFDAQISELHAEIAGLTAELHTLHLARKDAERGAALTETRIDVRRIEAEAERERARQTRNALQTIHGLPHAAHRPSAWWFPLLDPSGAWLREVARTAHFSLEPLT